MPWQPWKLIVDKQLTPILLGLFCVTWQADACELPYEDDSYDARFLEAHKQTVTPGCVYFALLFIRCESILKYELIPGHYDAAGGRGSHSRGGTAHAHAAE